MPITDELKEFRAISERIQKVITAKNITPFSSNNKHQRPTVNSKCFVCTASNTTYCLYIRGLIESVHYGRKEYKIRNLDRGT
jgi:hypothetical protein